MITRYKTGWELETQKDPSHGTDYGDCGKSGPLEKRVVGKYIRFDDLKAALLSLEQYSDECGDNYGGDCGLCGYDKEDPDGQWVKFEEVKQLFERRNHDKTH